MAYIVKYKGGLGNQMFQYAFYLAHKAKHRFSVYFYDIFEAQRAHQGFEIFKIFNVHGETWCRLTNRIYHSRLRKYLFRRFERCDELNDWTYDIKALEPSHSTIYEGFWQSYKYYLGIEEIIRKSFTFRAELLSEQTRELASRLKEINSVSIHVRRGDYLNQDGMNFVMPIAYYRNAIRYMNSHVDNPQYVIFSDDIEWTINELALKDTIFVDWNKGKDSWQDMYLMSQCKHNIIANSSFSWWGAWLNNNPEKIVYAPYYKGEFIPQEWIVDHEVPNPILQVLK